MKRLREIKNKNSIIKAVEDAKIVKKESVAPIIIEKKVEEKKVEGVYIQPNKTYKIIVDLVNESSNITNIDFVNDSNLSEILLKLQVNKQKKLLVISEQADGKWKRKAKVDLKDTKIHITICPTKTIIPLRIMNTITLNIKRVNRSRINLMKHSFEKLQMI